MPITSPSFCSGREVWRLAVPYSIRPDDPGLVSRGGVSALTKSVGAGNPGTLAHHSGAPTDTFSALVQVVTTGALGAATARGSLDGGTTWLPTTQIHTDGVWELQESGLFLRFAGSQVALDAWTFTATEAAGQAQIRRATGAALARKLRPRGDMPPTDYGDDIRLIHARLTAYELLRPLRGQERLRQQLEGMESVYRSALDDLRRISEEWEQSDLPGQESRQGVYGRSEDPQGKGDW